MSARLRPRAARYLPIISRVSVARTKIQRPRLRTGLTMPRPALEQRLVQALGEQPLVLLCAPAGCGKTALLARALEAVARRAWRGLGHAGSRRRPAPPAAMPVAGARALRPALAHLARRPGHDGHQPRPATAAASRRQPGQHARGLRARAWRDRARRPAPCRRRRGAGLSRPLAAASGRALDAGHRHTPGAGAAAGAAARDGHAHRVADRRTAVLARRDAGAAAAGRVGPGRGRYAAPTDAGLAGRVAAGAGWRPRCRLRQRHRPAGLRLSERRSAAAVGRRPARIPAAHQRAARARRRPLRGAHRRPARLGPPRRAGTAGPVRHAWSAISRAR